MNYIFVQLHWLQQRIQWALCCACVCVELTQLLSAQNEKSVAPFFSITASLQKALPQNAGLCTSIVGLFMPSLSQAVFWKHLFSEVDCLFIPCGFAPQYKCNPINNLSLSLLCTRHIHIFPQEVFTYTYYIPIQNEVVQYHWLELQLQKKILCLYIFYTF